MRIPKTLSDYPWVIVNLSCKLCARRGRYRLARLAARYGSEQTLDGLLADLAHGCPYWRSNPRKYDPRCGARFEDLDRLRPEDMPPDSGAPRQRAPAREDDDAQQEARPQREAAHLLPFVEHVAGLPDRPDQRRPERVELLAEVGVCACHLASPFWFARMSRGARGMKRPAIAMMSR